jgi:hypothetical protein
MIGVREAVDAGQSAYYQNNTGNKPIMPTRTTNLCSILHKLAACTSLQKGLP